MHRLFAAIRPPADIRAKLLGLMSGVTHARWQDDDQLHITLRFIGEVDRNKASDIADLLSHISFTPFEIALSGVGCFESKGHPHTLWAGLHPRTPLTHLHQKIDRDCLHADLLPDDRSYRPHITLARLNRATGPFDKFLVQHAGLASPSFMVNDFMLFESHLGQSGSTYHMIERYPAKAC